MLEHVVVPLCISESFGHEACWPAGPSSGPLPVHGSYSIHRCITDDPNWLILMALLDIVLASDNISLLSFESMFHAMVSNRTVSHSLSLLPMDPCMQLHLARNVLDIVQGPETSVHHCSYVAYFSSIFLPFYWHQHVDLYHLVHVPGNLSS
jgi:hypothetical protein